MANNYEFESKGFNETSASKPVGAALVAHVMETILDPVMYSQVNHARTNNGGEGFDWSAYSEEVKQNSANQALMAGIKGKASFEKLSPTLSLKEKITSWKYDSYRDLYVIFRTKGKKQFF
ncbi:hypothetical protein L1987_39977 [Smallanthus sonchifolius]|uniref:Uncharacterized protein n=1 Tax=Smallanthus sonchifolius TaxID=185202 RepID=A0ACB9GS83_9ASTR|nr:hypothetical protein L1987_39977 [Smallanthus sonchifolius]